MYEGEVSALLPRVENDGVFVRTSKSHGEREATFCAKVSDTPGSIPTTRSQPAPGIQHQTSRWSGAALPPGATICGLDGNTRHRGEANSPALAPTATGDDST